jgi:hypothetical protein
MVPNLVFVNRDGSVAFRQRGRERARSSAASWRSYGHSFDDAARLGHLLDSSPRLQVLNSGSGDPFTSILRRGLQRESPGRAEPADAGLAPVRAATRGTGRRRPLRRNGGTRQVPHSGNENIRAG